MVTKSECEHDVGFYRPISGDGGDITEECSKCGNRITIVGPKTVYQELLKEQKKQQKKRK